MLGWTLAQDERIAKLLEQSSPVGLGDGVVQEKEAKPELKGYNRRGWMAWLTGRTASLHGCA